MIFLISTVIFFIISKPLDVQPENPFYTKPAYWSNTYKDYDDFNIYTFPAVKLSNTGGSTFIMGNPTYDFSILSKKIPDGITQACIDIDQIYAVRAYHICTGTNNDFDNCIGQDGKLYNFGDVEYFYTNIICEIINQNNVCSTPLTFCSGNIGLLAIDFQPPQTLMCASCNESNCITVQCDPSSQDQLFRVNRVSLPSINPLSLPSGQATQGLYGNIYHRETNMYLNIITGSQENQGSQQIPQSASCVCVYNTGQFAQNVYQFGCTLTNGGCNLLCEQACDGGDVYDTRFNEYFGLTLTTQNFGLTSDDSLNWIFMPSIVFGISFTPESWATQQILTFSIPQQIINIGNLNINDIQEVYENGSTNNYANITDGTITQRPSLNVIPSGVYTGSAGVYLYLSQNECFALALNQETSELYGMQTINWPQYFNFSVNLFGDFINYNQIQDYIFKAYTSQLLTFNMYNSISQVDACNKYNSSSQTYCYSL